MTIPGYDPARQPPYVLETVALLGDRDPLAVMAETPHWLRRKLGNLPARAWRVPEAPGAWSLVEVISHLTDAEIVFGWRLRLVLTAEQAPLTGYDQGTWRERFNYDGADPDLALATFAQLRDWNLRTWRSVTEDDLGRMAIHAQRGPESLGLLRALTAGHDLRHRRQIDRLLTVVG